MKKTDGRSKAARAARAKMLGQEIMVRVDPQLQEKKANKYQVGGDHYKEMGVQPWDAMQSWMTEDEFAGFLRGSAIGYLSRCNKKGGLEDIKKAKHYLEKLVEVLEGV